MFMSLNMLKIVRKCQGLLSKQKKFPLSFFRTPRHNKNSKILTQKLKPAKRPARLFELSSENTLMPLTSQ